MAKGSATTKGTVRSLEIRLEDEASIAILKPPRDKHTQKDAEGCGYALWIGKDSALGDKEGWMWHDPIEDVKKFHTKIITDLGSLAERWRIRKLTVDENAEGEIVGVKSELGLTQEQCEAVIQKFKQVPQAQWDSAPIVGMRNEGPLARHGFTAAPSPRQGGASAVSAPAPAGPSEMRPAIARRPDLKVTPPVPASPASPATPAPSAALHAASPRTPSSASSAAPSGAGLDGDSVAARRNAVFAASRGPVSGDELSAKRALFESAAVPSSGTSSAASSMTRPVAAPSGGSKGGGDAAAHSPRTLSDKRPEASKFLPSTVSPSSPSSRQPAVVPFAARLSEGRSIGSSMPKPAAPSSSSVAERGSGSFTPQKPLSLPRPPVNSSLSKSQPSKQSSSLARLGASTPLTPSKMVSSIVGKIEGAGGSSASSGTPSALPVPPRPGRGASASSSPLGRSAGSRDSTYVGTRLNEGRGVDAIVGSIGHQISDFDALREVTRQLIASFERMAQAVIANQDISDAQKKRIVVALRRIHDLDAQKTEITLEEAVVDLNRHLATGLERIVHDKEVDGGILSTIHNQALQAIEGLGNHASMQPFYQRDVDLIRAEIEQNRRGRGFFISLMDVFNRAIDGHNYSRVSRLAGIATNAIRQAGYYHTLRVGAVSGVMESASAGARSVSPDGSDKKERFEEVFGRVLGGDSNADLDLLNGDPNAEDAIKRDEEAIKRLEEGLNRLDAIAMGSDGRRRAMVTTIDAEVQSDSLRVVDVVSQSDAVVLLGSAAVRPSEAHPAEMGDEGILREILRIVKVLEARDNLKTDVFNAKAERLTGLITQLRLRESAAASDSHGERYDAMRADVDRALEAMQESLRSNEAVGGDVARVMETLQSAIETLNVRSLGLDRLGAKLDKSAGVMVQNFGSLMEIARSTASIQENQSALLDSQGKILDAAADVQRQVLAQQAQLAAQCAQLLEQQKQLVAAQERLAEQSGTVRLAAEMAKVAAERAEGVATALETSADSWRESFATREVSRTRHKNLEVICGASQEEPQFAQILAELTELKENIAALTRINPRDVGGRVGDEMGYAGVAFAADSAAMPAQEEGNMQRLIQAIERLEALGEVADAAQGDEEGAAQERESFLKEIGRIVNAALSPSHEGGSAIVVEISRAVQSQVQDILRAQSQEDSTLSSRAISEVSESAQSQIREVIQQARQVFDGFVAVTKSLPVEGDGRGFDFKDVLEEQRASFERLLMLKLEAFEKKFFSALREENIGLSGGRWTEHYSGVPSDRGAGGFLWSTPMFFPTYGQEGVPSGPSTTLGGPRSPRSHSPYPSAQGPISESSRGGNAGASHSFAGHGGGAAALVISGLEDFEGSGFGAVAEGVPVVEADKMERALSTMVKELNTASGNLQILLGRFQEMLTSADLRDQSQRDETLRIINSALDNLAQRSALLSRAAAERGRGGGEHLRHLFGAGPADGPGEGGDASSLARDSRSAAESLDLVIKELRELFADERQWHTGQNQEFASQIERINRNLVQQIQGLERRFSMSSITITQASEEEGDGADPVVLEDRTLLTVNYRGRAVTPRGGRFDAPVAGPAAAPAGVTRRNSSSGGGGEGLTSHSVYHHGVSLHSEDSGEVESSEDGSSIDERGGRSSRLGRPQRRRAATSSDDSWESMYNKLLELMRKRDMQHKDLMRDVATRGLGNLEEVQAAMKRQFAEFKEFMGQAIANLRRVDGFRGGRDASSGHEGRADEGGVSGYLAAGGGSTSRASVTVGDRTREPVEPSAGAAAPAARASEGAERLGERYVNPDLDKYYDRTERIIELLEELHAKETGHSDKLIAALISVRRDSSARPAAPEAAGAVNSQDAAILAILRESQAGRERDMNEMRRLLEDERRRHDERAERQAREAREARDGSDVVMQRRIDKAALAFKLQIEKQQQLHDREARAKEDEYSRREAAFREELVRARIHSTEEASRARTHSDEDAARARIALAEEVSRAKSALDDQLSRERAIRQEAAAKERDLFERVLREKTEHHERLIAEIRRQAENSVGRWSRDGEGFGGRVAQDHTSDRRFHDIDQQLRGLHDSIAALGRGGDGRDGRGGNVSVVVNNGRPSESGDDKERAERERAEREPALVANRPMDVRPSFDALLSQPKAIIVEGLRPDAYSSPQMGTVVENPIYGLTHSGRDAAVVETYGTPPRHAAKAGKEFNLTTALRKSSDFLFGRASAFADVRDSRSGRDNSTVRVFFDAYRKLLNGMKLYSPGDILTQRPQKQDRLAKSSDKIRLQENAKIAQENQDKLYDNEVAIFISTYLYLNGRDNEMDIMEGYFRGIAMEQSRDNDLVKSLFVEAAEFFAKERNLDRVETWCTQRGGEHDGGIAKAVLVNKDRSGHASNLQIDDKIIDAIYAAKSRIGSAQGGGNFGGVPSERRPSAQPAGGSAKSFTRRPNLHGSNGADCSHW